MKNYNYQGILLLLLIVAISSCNESKQLITDSQYNLGTIINISFYGDATMRSTEALQSIDMDLKHFQRAWDPWGNYGMSRTNKLLATTKWFSFNPSIQELFIKAKKNSLNSQELFNPTMGKFTQLWGFNSNKITTNQPPTESQIKALLAQSNSIRDVEIKGVRMRSRNPNIFFDFGAIAKGLAIDMIINSLDDFNIKNAIINAGGDVKVIGNYENRPWHIGIPHPRIENEILAAIDIHSGESIFTSGDNERFFIYQGSRYHHIIDPRTGYPATETISVTVIHPDAAVADAAATALFVAGPSLWHQIAKSMKIKFVLLIDSKGDIHLNPAMQKRLQFKAHTKNIFVSQPL